MSVFYFFRHAESEMNTTPDLVGGRSNHVGLSRRGKKQAINLGQWIDTSKLTPAEVWSSEARRALLTCEIALKQTSINSEPRIDQRLLELSQGLYEGKPRTEVYTEEVLAEIAKLQKDFALEGGESMNDVAERLDQWRIEREVVHADDYATIFVFTHGIAIRCLVGKLLNWDHATILQKELKNASVTRIVTRNGIVEDVQFGTSTQPDSTTQD